MNEIKEFSDYLFNEYFSLKGPLLLAQYSIVEQRIKGLQVLKFFIRDENQELLQKYFHSISDLIQLIDANRYSQLENVQVSCKLLEISIQELLPSYFDIAYWTQQISTSLMRPHQSISTLSMQLHTLKLLLNKQHRDQVNISQHVLTILDLLNFHTHPDAIRSLLLCLLDLLILYPEQFSESQSELHSWILKNLFDLNNGWDENCFQLCGLVLACFTNSITNDYAKETFWNEQFLSWVKTAQVLSDQLFSSFPTLSYTFNFIHLDSFPIPNSQTKSNSAIEVFKFQHNLCEYLSRVFCIVMSWPLAPIHNSPSNVAKLNLILPLSYLLELSQAIHLLSQHLKHKKININKDSRGLSNTIDYRLELFLKRLIPFLVEYTPLTCSSELCSFVQTSLVQDYTNSALTHSPEYRKELIDNIILYFEKFHNIDSNWNSTRLILQLIQDCSIQIKNSLKINMGNIMGGSGKKSTQKRFKGNQLTNSDALQTQVTVYTVSDTYIGATRLLLLLINRGWYQLSSTQQNSIFKMVSDHLSLLTQGQLQLDERYLIPLFQLADKLTTLPHPNQSNICSMCFELYQTMSIIERGQLGEFCKLGLSRINRLIHPEIYQLPNL